jgi:hypothetical protein
MFHAFQTVRISCRYDRSIEILRTGIEQAKLGQKERMGAIRRLGEFYR